MSPEAEKILRAFRDRDLRSGGMIDLDDFGDAIVWKAGFVRDEPIRQALALLFEEGYLLEYNTAVELTDRGEQYIYADDEPAAKV